VRTALVVALCAAPAFAQPVRVQVDMNPSFPGLQPTVRVEPGVTVVPVAVYVYDPEGTRQVLSIGYVGGLDRGIAFGHVVTPAAGQVVAVVGTAGAPVNPGGTPSVFPAQWRMLSGKEVQYIEHSAPAPAPIQQTPVHPIFRAEVHLSGAVAGDSFRFVLVDAVRVWNGMGAFTTAPGQFLDTGGDVVPDGTVTMFGVDVDTPIPVPPASFPVDYIDGGSGPATITVACYADCNADGALNLADFGCFQTHFAQSDPFADCNGDGALNLADFGCFQTRFALGCP
jgi:hypothetical protein